MEEKAKRPMRKSAAKRPMREAAAKRSMQRSMRKADKDMSAEKRSVRKAARKADKDTSSKLAALRKENKELKAQLKGSGAKKGEGDMGKKESMKERMERLRNMRKKK